MKLPGKLLPLLLLLACLGLPRVSFGQIKVTPFDRIDELQKVDPRPMVVFIHTDWCKYCQGMKNTAFKNERVIQLLNSKFYFLDLNAEEKRQLRFRQATFRFKPTGNNTGVNELAEQLGNNKGTLSYPTLCFMNARYEILYQHQGFIDAAKLIRILEHL